MKSMTKDGEPTGIPSRQKPLVNLTGVGWDYSLGDVGC